MAASSTYSEGMVVWVSRPTCGCGLVSPCVPPSHHHSPPGAARGRVLRFGAWAPRSLPECVVFWRRSGTPGDGRTSSGAPCGTRSSACPTRTSTSRSSAFPSHVSRKRSRAPDAWTRWARPFTVFKVSGLEGTDGAVDVSLPPPRLEGGTGHRGIAVTGDPGLSLEEAARRRDFTINAVMFDPSPRPSSIPSTAEATSSGGSCGRWIRRRWERTPCARCARPAHRALRAERGSGDGPPLRVDGLAELPAERVFGEIRKLLLKARRPRSAEAPARVGGC